MPPVVGRLHATLFDPTFQHVQPLFTLAAADDLADSRHQNVHRADGFSVLVTPHVIRFNRSRVIVQDDRLLEGLLGQESFVLGLQIATPLDGILKLLPARQQNVDRLCVG